ncbi:metal ABC transporter solute-binding protein, Zn/Mn family [Nonlabens ponticola]|uniref:Manganese transporter n=1 Tax=Nonlabens ponticola TaxID=2496866 RepID=A0A3S9N145_9FLAO|nr:zinc ABC transporter substrate-binding protein [Nonlabens ponticola]AZQ45140.1 manganese transporter [Nonlabens ponticola]
MKKLSYLLCALLLVGCKDASQDNGKLNVVTTTTMITDMVGAIGGDAINLQGLMGSGVDPHLYKPSEGDVSKLQDADVIFYNGLHLEGKLVDIFEKMEARDKNAIAVSDAIDKSTLIGSEYFASNYDPHVWFDTDYWISMSRLVAQELTAADPENKETYEQNLANYISSIEELAVELKQIIDDLPAEKRILVTAHDAFNYYGRKFGFEVVGLQGLSTATEAGVQDVQNITQFIIENDIKAVFVESSVPRRTVEALQAAVRAQDREVEIGGELYSDALGSAGTAEGTYVGMYKHNVNTIVNALK